jgi:Na+/melibiose symporter-like transporter
VVVGTLGGYYAARREMATAFLVAACFPLVSFALAALFIHEAPAATDREAFRRTWLAIRETAKERETWVVAGFIFFFMFSPSLGPAFLYYQTDVLRFDQQFIGVLDSLASAGAVAGALLYAPLSRRVALRPLIVWSIGTYGVSGLGLLLYRDPVSAVLISIESGIIYMVTQLAFLDLAARASPRRVEATFFAFMTAVSNGGTQAAANVGARLYDWVGFTPLVLISAATTLLTWALVPLVDIDGVERRARAEGAISGTAPPA